jgi:hypothetical protein
MVHKASLEPDKLPGGPLGEILVWTPPAIPWFYWPWDLKDLDTLGYVEYLGGGTISQQAYNHAVVCWADINEKLQGAKPIRWINLASAAWIIGQKLNKWPGEAFEILRSEATPLVVPWVGVCTILKYDGRREWEPRAIEHGPFTRAEIHFYDGCVYFPGQDEPLREPYVELNHLEAWLKKYKARGARLGPVPPEDRPKPNGEPTKQKQARQTNSEDDAGTKRKIEAGIARRQGWPKNKQQLSERQQADLLADELRKSVGYSVPTMRAILRGGYPAMIKLGIPNPK